MDEMASSNGPALKLGFSFPSSSNLDSISWKELIELAEKGGGSLTVSVRKLYLIWYTHSNRNNGTGTNHITSEVTET